MGKGLKSLVGKTCRYLSNVKSTIYLSSIVMVGIDKILLPSCQDNGLGFSDGKSFRVTIQSAVPTRCKPWLCRVTTNHLKLHPLQQFIVLVVCPNPVPVNMIGF